MIGVYIEGEADNFYDNESVHKNDSLDESQIKKIHQAICFHRAREWMANKKIIAHNVDNNDNIADILTNLLPCWKRVKLIFQIMYSENPNISWDAS